MNNNEIKTSYGVIRNINNKKSKKRKLTKNGIIAIAATSIILIASLMAVKNHDKGKISPLKEGQVKTYITVQVENGDTISEIADRFYSEDCDDVYNSLSNFEEAIQEQNNINKYISNIDVGDEISVPVIVDNTNPYYMEILEIENKIKEVEANNLWVMHKVEYGESISELAMLASGNEKEAYSVTNEILNKNNMDFKDILVEGKQIWIKNPLLGELKSELNDVLEQFKLSLMNNQAKK